MNFTFNRRPLVERGSIEQPSQVEVKSTPSLWQADLDTAVRYGGDLTRAALGAMEIVGDKRFVVVDTKVHMLMPGQCPAIPGWHTDGAPRRIKGPTGGAPIYRWQEFSPLGSGPPELEVQEVMDERGDRPRFHLLVTGEGCLTEFLRTPFDLDVPADVGSDLYAWITRRVEALRSHYELEHPADLAAFDFAPSCTAVEWDWWNLHQGVIASKREWRFLIRVTESDYHEPLPPSRLHEIIRTQQMVYTPAEFGW